MIGDVLFWICFAAIVWAFWIIYRRPYG